jgi:hypothetical protein
MPCVKTRTVMIENGMWRKKNLNGIIHVTKEIIRVVGEIHTGTVLVMRILIGMDHKMIIEIIEEIPLVTNIEEGATADMDEVVIVVDVVVAGMAIDAEEENIVTSKIIRTFTISPLMLRKALAAETAGQSKRSKKKITIGIMVSSYLSSI